jgi:hypothetical protein
MAERRTSPIDPMLSRAYRTRPPDPEERWPTRSANEVSLNPLESLVHDARPAGPGDASPLRQYLVYHTVRTAFREGWATLANGELLMAAEAAGFEVFLTTDKNLRRQQDLSNRRVAVVVSGHAQWPGLEPPVQLVVAAVDRAVEGGYDEVAIPVD